MASKLRVVTDVDEAWRLRQAGLLWFEDRKAGRQLNRKDHNYNFGHPTNAGRYSVLCEEDDEE